MAEETNHNNPEEIAPTTVESPGANSSSEEKTPTTVESPVANISPEEKTATTVESPGANDIPSANTSAPKTVNPEPKAVEKTAKKPEAKVEGDAAAKKPAAKKEKAPALEDKPFTDFIQQDVLPGLKQALAKQGVQQLNLSFEKQKIPIIGFAKEPECWQIIGSWNRGLRQFRVYFFKEDIQAERAFSFAENGGKPSILEPFLIDERKITLDLILFGVVQRLNAQKWLVRN